jgi:hypothetical protein
MDAATGARGCTKETDPGSGTGGFVAHCPHCRGESIFLETRVSTRKHLLLTLVTAGLWLIPWSALLMGKVLRPYRCGVCGWHKPEFRKTASLSIASFDPSSTPKKMQPPTVE